MPDSAKHIIIVSGFPLSMNPRIVKEADALSDAGYRVTVLTSILNKTRADIDTGIAEGKRWTPEYLIDQRSISKIRWNYLRFRRRFFLLIYQVFGWAHHNLIGYFTSELIARCKRSSADHLSLHVESGLAVLPYLKEEQSCSLDFEDWYSRDLVDQQHERPTRLLAKWEGQALQCCRFVTCASDSMGAALADVYACRQPVTIYNCFSKDQLQAQKQAPGSPFRIVWFSQSIGPGRGLEELAAAMASLDMSLELHLLGNPNQEFQEQLYARFENIQLHEFVHPHELVPYLSRFDVGFAGEKKLSQSRDVTVTNKIFQYMLAALPVIASDTKGQIEIARKVPDALRVYQDQDSLVSAIRFWMNPGNYARGSKAARESAAETFNWESESQKLVKLMHDTIGLP